MTKPTVQDQLAVLRAHPIAVAVEPSRTEAMDRARKDAARYIDRLMTELAVCDMDANKFAPLPHGRMGKAEYRQAMTRHQIIRRLTTRTDRSTMYRRNEPVIVVRNLEAEAVYIEQAALLASGQYDAFIVKLIGKIGDCDDAKLTGSHVWGHSVLTVTKGDLIEQWKTQQIVNISVLGLVFNQWPSRKLK